MRPSWVPGRVPACTRSDKVIGAASPAGAAALALATVVKLSRVLMLAPVVAVAGLLRRRTTGGHASSGKLPPLVPLFVLGFLGCVVARSTGIVRPEGLDLLGHLQTVAAGLFGMGTGVHLRPLPRATGPALAVAAAGSAVLGVMSLHPNPPTPLSARSRSTLYVGRKERQLDNEPRIHRMSIDVGTEMLYAELIRHGAPGEGGDMPETVVFCHGVGGNHASWFQQVPHFAPHFPVLTWDQRGFGNSSNQAGHASPAQAVADLRAIVGETGLGRVHLVGQSMGGWAALGYALEFPGDVMSLVLSDSLGGMFTDAARATFDAHLTARTAAAAIPPALGANAAIADDLVKRDPALAFLFQEIASFSRQVPSDVLSRLLEAEVSIDTVAGLEIPMLFILGEWDHIFPPRAVRDVVAQIPHAELTVIPGAGHSAYFECAQQFNTAVLTHVVASHPL
jgi:3-oxoadipate enol-lactonase